MSDEKKKEKVTEEKKPLETSKKNTSSSMITKILLIAILALVGYLIYTKTQEGSSESVNQDASESEEIIDLDLASADAADPQKWSYAFGRVMGRDIASALDTFSEGPAVDKGAIVEAIEDALNDVESMSDAELEAIIQARIQLEQDAIKARGEENKATGAAYLEQYASSEGVVAATNGSLYKVITAGSGELVGENVASVVYIGKHIDGEVFDSTDKNGGAPAQFVRESVIPGLGEILPEMKVGDKWEIVIPAEGAYGENGIPGVILPHEVLVFEIEIVGVAPRPEQLQGNADVPAAGTEGPAQ